MPEGRLLMKNITTSEKIASLSPDAALLFTWAISFEDSAGYIEAEPGYLKGTIFPLRNDLSVDDVRGLIVEVIRSEAWLPFKAKDNHKRWVWDPKFEEHQRRRDKSKEANSKFCVRDKKELNDQGHRTFRITGLHVGLEPVPLEDVERVWNEPSHSGGNPPSAPKTPPDGPRSSPPNKMSKLKDAFDKDPELYDLATTLKGDKWPDVNGFIGKALKEIPSLNLEDMKQTLRIVIEKESFDEERGGIFAFARAALESVVHDNVTRRVEDKAQRDKEDEAKGPEQVGKVLEGLNK